MPKGFRDSHLDFRTRTHCPTFSLQISIRITRSDPYQMGKYQFLCNNRKQTTAQPNNFKNLVQTKTVSRSFKLKLSIFSCSRGIKTMLPQRKIRPKRERRQQFQTWRLCNKTLFFHRRHLFLQLRMYTQTCALIKHLG